MRWTACRRAGAPLKLGLVWIATSYPNPVTFELSDHISSVTAGLSVGVGCSAYLLLAALYSYCYLNVQTVIKSQISECFEFL
jgi:hypothetical protein